MYLSANAYLSGDRKKVNYMLVDLRFIKVNKVLSHLNQGFGMTIMTVTEFRLSYERWLIVGFLKPASPTCLGFQVRYAKVRVTSLCILELTQINDLNYVPRWPVIVEPYTRG